MTRAELKLSVATFLGWLGLRLLAMTWRVRWVNDDVLRESHRTKGPVIFVLWHGQLLPLIYAHRKGRIAAMVSEHRDGELIARVMERLGLRTVRGSTSRGAARALLAACREVEQGFDVALTVDGPRGPARSVAPGSLVISQRTGAPMIPVAAEASRAWRLRSWDRFLVPKPFARVTVAYGPTFGVSGTSARDAAGEAETVRTAIEGAEQIAQAHARR